MMIALCSIGRICICRVLVHIFRMRSNGAVRVAAAQKAIKLRNAKSMKELHEAEQFYNWRVVPSQIERLKKESLKYSFEHDSSLSRLIGDIWE